MNKRPVESSLSDEKIKDKKIISNLIPTHLQKSAFTKAISAAESNARKSINVLPKSTLNSTTSQKNSQNSQKNSQKNTLKNDSKNVLKNNSKNVLKNNPKTIPNASKSRNKIMAKSNSRKLNPKNSNNDNNRYLIRSRIIANRKSKLDSMIIRNGGGNRYVMPRKNAPKVLKLDQSRKGSTDKNKDKKNKNVPMYSGTIIYNGKSTLHPYKWTPGDLENSPAHYKWDTLLPGTHVLDQNTCLTWIVNSRRGLDMAPCQTIKLEMNVPNNLDEFNPGLSLNPYLPESKQIPAGTRFIFNNSNRVYLFNSEFRLIPLAPSGTVGSGSGSGSNREQVARPSQVIPIAINSMFNTNRLWGLNTPVTHSELQTPSGPDGFETLQEWFESLIKGTETRPGYLGKLPTLDQLQPYDVLDFYDPNLKLNPRINGLNPDATAYIDQLHESKYFHFRLQVTAGNGGQLGAREIIQPISPFICNISIPTAKTNQDRPIYIRSATLIPHLGDPLKVVNQIEQPYYLDSELDADRLIEDFKYGLLQLGYPYEQIKVTYLGENGDFYVVRFSNLPTHLWGIVLSSDQMPLNKYAGSGRFYLGYSANSQGITYECKLDSELGGYSKDGLLSLENLSVHDVTVDGILIKVSETGVISFNSNQQLGVLFGRINSKLGGIGYPGYVLNAWWNESEHEFKFYLSGVVNGNLPNIMMNINNNLITLDFTV
jgi:hypothetical protein